MSRRKISKSAARRLYDKGVTIEVIETDGYSWYCTLNEPVWNWARFHSLYQMSNVYYVDLNAHFERTYNETK